MKLGLIARCDDRGLGLLTWEVYRHLQPARTLVVVPGAEANGRSFAQYPERYTPAHVCEVCGPADYPGPATVARWTGLGLDLSDAAVAGWVDGLDAIYTAEVLYDQRILSAARAAGVPLVLHTMPEFHRPELDADRWWLPSPWRAAALPSEAKLVPVPVATCRLAPAPADPHTPGPLRVLHTAGHRAMADRNGTTTVLQAARYLRAPTEVTILGQGSRLPFATGLPRNVRVHSQPGGRANYWTGYSGHHAIALPRRYGGLCLPLQEASAAGLALVMPDTEPHRWWPGAYVPADPGATIAMAGGEITTYDTRPRALAETLDALNADRDRLADLQRKAAERAEAHSWAALRSYWLSHLAS